TTSRGSGALRRGVPWAAFPCRGWRARGMACSVPAPADRKGSLNAHARDEPVAAPAPKPRKPPEGGFREQPRRRPALPPRLQGSTIGAGGLNFRVRNGTGCLPSAMATETVVPPPCSCTGVHRNELRHGRPLRRTFVPRARAFLRSSPDELD